MSIALHRHLGHLEDGVTGMADDFRADFDHLFTQRCQRSVPPNPGDDRRSAAKASGTMLTAAAKPDFRSRRWENRVRGEAKWPESGASEVSDLPTEAILHQKSRLMLEINHLVGVSNLRRGWMGHSSGECQLKAILAVHGQDSPGQFRTVARGR